MVSRFLFVIAVVLFAASLDASTGVAGETTLVAQNQSQICFDDCITKHGADSKAACARQCGLAGGATAPRKDCGVVYKNCIADCGKKDKACRKQCRTDRRSCV
jgi:hypothetical protein